MKLYITEKRNGVEKRCTLITMVLWNLSHANNKNQLTFHLDNPPMRADVWNELVAPPHRIWKNKSYHKFQTLIHEITNFQAKDSPQSDLAKKFKEGLLELETAIVEGGSRTMSALLKLRDILPDDCNEELQEKFKHLDELVINSPGEYTEKIREQLELTRRECHYIALSDEAAQINEYIHTNVEKWWDNSIPAQFLNKRIIPNLPGIILSIILLLFFNFSGSDPAVFISATIPTILSILINIIAERFGEGK